VRRRVAAALSIIPGVGHLTLGCPWWGQASPSSARLRGGRGGSRCRAGTPSGNGSSPRRGTRCGGEPRRAVALYAVIYLHLPTLAASSPAPFSDGPRGARTRGWSLMSLEGSIKDFGLSDISAHPRAAEERGDERRHQSDGRRSGS
jgi:hypothetical protein